MVLLGPLKKSRFSDGRALIPTGEDAYGPQNELNVSDSGATTDKMMIR